MSRFISFVTFVLIFSTLSYATTFFVDNDQTDDSASGLNWSEAKKTISAAIEVSSPGDTIIIKYGTYLLTESILVSSDRKLTSDNGTNESWDTVVYDSSACILSGDNSVRIFTIVSDSVTDATTIRGFRITQGNARYDTTEASYGGGVCIADSADPIIEYCRITDNKGTNDGNGFGGGVAIIGADTDPIIRYCKIDSNLASSGYHGYGAGIYIKGSNLPQIHNNVIHNNIAATSRTAHGGGIYCESSNAEIYSNSICLNIGSYTGNPAGGSGGGIFVTSGNVQITSNIINYNTAADARSGKGGGIYFQALQGYIHNNDISYNIAATTEEGTGGGLYLAGDGIVTTFNTISNNIACTSSNNHSFSWTRGSGGGAFVDGIFQNNTVIHNKASVHGRGNGGGIYFGTGNNISYNIIAYNVASDSADGYGGGGWAYNSASSTLANNVFYSNANQSTNIGSGHGSGFYYWYGGYSFVFKNNIFSNHNLPGSDSTAVHFDEAFTIYNNCFYQNGTDYNVNVTSNNEVLANPQFIEADAGNFEILYNSPCIDAGADTLVYDEADNHDMGWVVDIGVHEYMDNRVTKVIDGAGEYWFGGQVRAKVNVTDPGSLSQLEIKVHANELHPQADASVQRWFEIIPTGAGATFDLTLSYKDTELNSQDEHNLNVWRWDDSDWYGPKSASDSSTADNWLTVTGQMEFSDWVISQADSTGALPVQEKSNLVHKFQLLQNYPNPFNPMTFISYELPVNGIVELSVFNLLGQKVATLVSANQTAGVHKVKWDASTFSSGVYFYQLQTSTGRSDIKKMVLVK